MKNKILFILPNLAVGGAERVATTILRQMDLSKFDIFLVLVSKNGELLKLIPKEIEIIDLASSKTMFSILKLRVIIKSIQPDIIFSTLFRTHIAVDLALTGIKKKPKLIFRSSNSPKLLIENKQLGKFMKFMLEKAYENANLVIAQTPEMKIEIEEYHNINEKKIIVFLNPIDSKLIDESVNNIENPFDSRYINVVASGRLSYQKGFDVLIKSFSKVILSNDKFRLYIVGEEREEESNLLQLIQELDLKNYVFLVGFKPNPYQYFYYSDLYVLSSRWEGLPNTVLENLYLKKPIVVTRCIPFMDTLVKDKENGILVDVENYLELSKAILNYKNIDNTEENSILFDNDINLLFSNILKGVINE